MNSDALYIVGLFLNLDEFDLYQIFKEYFNFECTNQKLQIGLLEEMFCSRCFKHSDPNDELQYSVVYSMNNRTNMIDQYKNSISLTAFLNGRPSSCVL